MQQLFACALVTGIAVVPARAYAQERPYFVTYDHYLEEPGNLEVATAMTTGIPKAGKSSYTAPWLELEYGIKGWWTTELYVEGTATRRDGSGLTGWRWENRFRPLRGEHRVNPVLYVEYEHINEASRIQKEIVGKGGIEYEPITELREERERALEAKLILSSTVGAWNASQNVIVEKNLSRAEGLAFGYSFGFSRPLGLLASEKACRMCAENFVVGAEAYGGLGSGRHVGPRGARHYAAPVLAWRASDRSVLKFSAGIGLTEASDRLLLRVGWAYEFGGRKRP